MLGLHVFLRCTFGKQKSVRNLILWSGWGYRNQKVSGGLHRSELVSAKNWVSAALRPCSIRRHDPRARSAVQEALLTICHGIMMLLLLILPMLRPNIKNRVCLGLPKPLIIMEISSDLDSTARTTHEERLLRLGKMHALLVVRMKRALANRTSATRPAVLTTKLKELLTWYPKPSIILCLSL